MDKYVGVSESSLAQLGKALESRTLDYQAICQLEIQAKGVVQKITLGVDETFFDRMILVAMDLTSGFIFTEIFSQERSFLAWQQATSCLSEWQVAVEQVVSDRAKALIKLAEFGWKRFHIPDLFHASREISLALGKALARRVQRAETTLAESKKRLEKEEKLFAHLTPSVQEKVLLSPKEKVELARDGYPFKVGQIYNWDELKRLLK